MQKQKNKDGKSVYERFDTAVMKGINVGVRAWNWTTGMTKADLANVMSTIAPVLESIGYANSSRSFIAVPFTILISHTCQKINEKMEQKEAKALERGAKDMEVERDKAQAAMVGPSFLLASATWAVYHKNNGLIVQDTTQPDYFTALGNGIMGLSFYVMRADYLPPSKNCITRAWEGTREMLRCIKGIPEPAMTASVVALKRS